MSFQQGVSGLNAAGRNLDVIGNNVANASTIGAKGSRAEFADIYARNSGAGALGIGVSVSTVTQSFNQGSVSSTGNALDVAINGAGFFQLEDPNGMVQYGRNGQFKLNRDGDIVNAQGLLLLGHPINSATGIEPGQATAMRVPTVGAEPTKTTNVTLEINLNSESNLIDPGVNPMRMNDANTYNNSTSLTVYDAKGQSVAMTYFFQKTANDEWNVYVAANGEAVNPDGDGNPQAVQTLSFLDDGSGLVSPNAPFLLTVPSTGVGGSSETVEMTDLEIDLTGMTQFGAPFGPTNLSQNGTPAGRLSSVSVEDDGTVMASYSNGISSAIGQIELANFRNVQGLRPLGGNTWAMSYESGDAILGAPGGGNLGTLQSQSLEESNIDLTNELVNMMVAQRIYQANAQTIKTQDQVMQTLVNLR